MQYHDIKELEPIMRYSMDDIESKAFKIGLMWYDECKSNLPNENHERFRKGKDPRKTNLFKHCYKIAKELKGLVPDEDMRLYVRAQIQVLKSIREGKLHALISPHCLVGDKAWRRWKFWKKIYDSQLARNLTSDELGIIIKESMVRKQFQRTILFLESNGMKDREKYESSPQDLHRWISTGEISPFYTVLSPWIKSVFKECPVDYSLYRPSITPSLESTFKEIFIHEFS